MHFKDKDPAYISLGKSVSDEVLSDLICDSRRVSKKAISTMENVIETMKQIKQSSDKQVEESLKAAKLMQGELSNVAELLREFINEIRRERGESEIAPFSRDSVEETEEKSS